MSDKKQYEKPVLEYVGSMTERTAGGSTNNGVGSGQYYDENYQ